MDRTAILHLAQELTLTAIASAAPGEFCGLLVMLLTDDGRQLNSTNIHAVQQRLMGRQLADLLIEIACEVEGTDNA